MTAEVGSGQVAIFPIFKGFRKAVTTEIDGTTKEAGSRFTSGFRSAGGSAGKGFSSAFKSATSGALTDALAKASRDVAASRLRELDATGRLRLAETQLGEARSRFSSDSSQVVRAEERVATAERAAATAAAATTTASTRLAASKRDLASAADQAASSGSRLGSVWSRLTPTFASAGRSSGSAFRSQFIGVLGGVVGGNILTGIGFTIGREINRGIGAAIGVGFQSIQLASDLNETTSAVRQVFGSAADEIIRFSTTTDRALGETQQEALAGAQTFGIFGKSAGLTGKPLATFSDNLVQLSGDLASFFNTSPEDAAEALSAGLRGESEPLRRYGVLLDDQTLRAKALALGIYDGSGALTQQQRILAAQSVIMQQTSIAQGDFTRTSAGLANQQRVLQAELTSTEVKLGAFFLPTANKLVAYATGTFLPSLDSVIDRVGPRLTSALDDAGPGAKRLLEKVAPLVEKLADGGANAIPSFIGGLNDMVDAAPGWISALKQVNDAGDHFADFLDTIGVTSNKPQQDFENGIGPGIEKSLGQFRDFFKTALPGGLGLGAVGKDASSDFIDGFAATAGDPAAIQKVKASGGSVGVNYVSGFAQAASPQVAHDQGFGFANGFGLGLAGEIPAVGTNGTFLGRAAVNGVESLRGEFAKTGYDFGDGLVNSIRSKQDAVGAAASLLGHRAVNDLRFAMDARSPSRKSAAAGDDFVTGFVQRIDAGRAQAGESATGLAIASLAGLSVGSVAGSAASAASVQAASVGQWAGPSTLVVVDADGHIMAHLQVAADQSFDRKLGAIRTEVLAGGSV